MKRALLFVAIAFVVSGCATRYPSKPGGKMPSYIVTGEPSAGSLAALTQDLGLAGKVRVENGAVQYVAENFLAVPEKEVGVATRDEEGEPAVARSFDFAALRAIKAPDEKQAAARFEQALRKADLPIYGQQPLKAMPVLGHSQFTAVSKSGEALADAMLDTHVSYTFTLDGVPLIGPGAELKAVFDQRMETTLLRAALRGLSRGPDIAVIDPASAPGLCQSALRAKFGAQSGGIQARSTLVYYAPPPDIATVRAIYPHYVCEGTITVGKEQVLLRKLIIPAVVDAPRVELAPDFKGDQATLRAKVGGGTGPYTYVWTLPDGRQERSRSPELVFNIASGAGKRGAGTAGLMVIDANGLTAEASVAVPAAGNALPPGMMSQSPGFEVGTEWIGDCGGLGGSQGNAGGFVSGFTGAGVPSRFNWGNFNAWQRDFLDTQFVANALDQDFVDRVDFVFYTGHANGDGFTFCSEENSGFLGFGDNPRWGDLELEWLVIAACGPLQPDSSGQRWWQRWGPAFEGLHLYMGYQTVTFDNEQEGSIIATRTLAGSTVRNAWVEAATATQGASEIWAVMGVIGTAGMSNYEDHVWGEGSVGPDIRGANIVGYWMISGPS